MGMNADSDQVEFCEMLRKFADEVESRDILVLDVAMQADYTEAPGDGHTIRYEKTGLKYLHVTWKSRDPETGRKDFGSYSFMPCRDDALQVPWDQAETAMVVMWSGDARYVIAKWEKDSVRFYGDRSSHIENEDCREAIKYGQKWILKHRPWEKE